MFQVLYVFIALFKIHIAEILNFLALTEKCDHADKSIQLLRHHTCSASSSLS